MGMIPLINYDSSEGEQWGRYNLPRVNGKNVLLVKIEGPGAGIPSIIIETCR